MLSKEQKKEAIKQFKERKPSLGVYRVRCTANGREWVGATRNLDAMKNSTWFTLRHGSHRDSALQADWNAYGQTAFEYDVLEKLGDVQPLAISDLLVEKRKAWVARLGALPLL